MTVVYQAYVRSFADANGDGVGDLAGVRSKLDYLADLGIDTLWLSPIHPSPNVDWGYDVADYRAVAPEFGTLADYESLIREARAKGIDVWLDLVPNHTSDQHAWFTERPEYYVWSKTVPNDWTSIFTGKSAWHWHEGRQQYYLAQFAPQQPDLDWWNEDVRREFDEILRFWSERGVKGVRIDVAHGLIKDRKLRNGHQYLRERPEVHEIYARWKGVAPGLTLMGETYVMPVARLAPYWQHLDLAQNFNFVRSDFELDQLKSVVEQTLALIPATRRPVWFGSNHDHSRLATRWGHPEAVLFLLLTLPGVAILYQGDEIGLADGHVPPERITDLADPPRDPERTPLPWTPSGDEWRNPWLPLEDTSRNVETSPLLSYTRDLIAARKQFGDDSYETLDSPTGIWAYRRGDRICRLNMTGKKLDGLDPWQGRID
ncbi:MAG TPA: alpha-amylase family glycosyl hydrolase [Gaiellaceae bacterium]|nr:alpha-amylase family glycosyl hydrolase [Gaiellaceae bacterium]